MPTSDLARQLAAHPRWRWAPGMRIIAAGGAQGTVTGYRSPVAGRVDVAWDGGVRDCRTDPTTLGPDLTDAATAGILLDQIDAPMVTAHRREVPDSWRVSWLDADGRATTTPWVDTLGEAAARALLALWSEVPRG